VETFPRIAAKDLDLAAPAYRPGVGVPQPPVIQHREDRPLVPGHCLVVFLQLETRSPQLLGNRQLCHQAVSGKRRHAPVVRTLADSQQSFLVGDATGHARPMPTRQIHPGATVALNRTIEREQRLVELGAALGTLCRERGEFGS
jgi:hypothetical protein